MAHPRQTTAGQRRASLIEREDFHVTEREINPTITPNSPDGRLEVIATGKRIELDRSAMFDTLGTDDDQLMQASTTGLAAHGSRLRIEAIIASERTMRTTETKATSAESAVLPASMSVWNWYRNGIAHPPMVATGPPRWRR